MWPCANCGDEQPVQRNSIVSFRAEPYREVRKTLVCEACADELRRETPQDARLPRRTDVASTRRATLGRVRDRLRR
jgi:phage terminase large subunit GpA-like protein